MGSEDKCLVTDAMEKEEAMLGCSTEDDVVIVINQSHLAATLWTDVSGSCWGQRRGLWGSQGTKSPDYFFISMNGKQQKAQDEIGTSSEAKESDDGRVPIDK